jgi:signal peptidase I
VATTTPQDKEEQLKDSGEQARPDEKPPAPGPPRGLLREYIESGAVVLVMAIFFMTFVAQAAEVPSASMENTIYVGDRFLINKFIFGPGPVVPFLPQREIRRGDIIVFKYPAKVNTDKDVVQYKTLFIKRVIGLPGETVEVKGANVYIDGKLLPEYRVKALDVYSSDKAELKKLIYPQSRAGEPYTVYYKPETLSMSDTEAASSFPSGFHYAVTRPFTVPAGQYFVMGDNRDNSADSRVWGTVPRDLIVGRAMFVIWSYDESAPRGGKLGILSDFFNNTRWNRIGTLLR